MNRINRWVIGTLPFAILISIILYSRYTISYYFALGAVCFALFFINFLSNKQFVIKKYTVLVLLFGIYVIFSNYYIAENRFIFYNEIVKNQYFYAFFVLNIIENTVFTRQQIRRWFIVFEITIWITLIVILIQQFYNHDFLQNRNVTDAAFEKTYVSESEKRLISIFSWSGILDLIFYFIPICFFQINYELNRNKVFKAVMYTFILIVVCVLSKARTTMMPAAMVFLILRSSYHKKNFEVMMNRIIVITVILFAAYAAFTTIPFLNDILRDRILESSRVDKEKRTMNTRLLAVDAFVKFFPDHPVFGCGDTKYGSGSKGLWNYKLESFLGGRSSQIHVGFLDLFYLYGLVGGALFALFIFIALRKFYLKSKLYNFRAVFWALMTLPIANIGLVSFNLMSAGLLLSFVFYRNLEVFGEKTAVSNKLPNPSTQEPEVQPSF
jgi:hypothetical protein